MPKGQEKSILCVDDEPLIISALKRILHPLPFTVYTATNAQEAAEVIGSTHPELIFLDIHMPGITGYELIPEIKRLEPDTQIVFITGYASDEDIIKGYSLGCSYYISKPFKPEYITNIVNYFLSPLSEKEKQELELKL